MGAPLIKCTPSSPKFQIVPQALIWEFTVCTWLVLFVSTDFSVWCCLMVATHRVVMDTLGTWFSLFLGSTFLFRHHFQRSSVDILLTSLHKIFFLFFFTVQCSFQTNTEAQNRICLLSLKSLQCTLYNYYLLSLQTL